MRLAVMYSGGKDSTMALHRVVEEGHDIAALVSVSVRSPDSYMFHVPAIELTVHQALAMRTRRVVVDTSGEKEREVDELGAGLRGLEAEGMVTGALSSEYQRTRFKRIADDLGWEFVAPLWGRDPWEHVEECAGRFEAVFTGVAADGMGREWLGRRLDSAAIADLRRLNARNRVHPSGEGGEFETAVLDAPLFKERIQVDWEPVWEGSRGHVRIKSVERRTKPASSHPAESDTI
jgi:ABC transporter with metal-binding/Fe-S-binding domain ATP-binding protein